MTRYLFPFTLRIKDTKILASSRTKFYHKLTLSRNQPAATPLLSCRIRTLVKLPMFGQSTLKVSTLLSKNLYFVI